MVILAMKRTPPTFTPTKTSALDGLYWTLVELPVFRKPESSKRLLIPWRPSLSQDLPASWVKFFGGDLASKKPATTVQ